MKKLVAITCALTMAMSMGAFAGDKKGDPKIAKLTKEINELEVQLAVKKDEYATYIRSIKDDVKARGNASQCSYTCNLHHRDDYYMWNQCFRACTN